MRVESGPARTDRNWQIVRFVLFLGFTAWFLYDGWIRYPAQNREAAQTALQSLPPFDRQKLAFDKLPDWSQTEFDAARRMNPRLEDLHRRFGAPTFTDGLDEYFVSQYGYGRVGVQGGTIASGEWRKWPNGGRSREEMQAQPYWGIIPALFALYFLWKLYRAATLHVTVDDEGLSYAGKRIAFADMTSLRDYNKKGWIDLYYRVGEDEAKLRLDNEKIALFDEVVEAICQTKHFKNEVRAYKEEEAREEAEQAAAEQAEQQDTGDEVASDAAETGPGGAGKTR